MTDFVELARGLLTLEINTVLKDGMSAQKMPSAGDARIDLAQAYHVFLCQQAGAFGAIGSGREASGDASVTPSRQPGRR